jgi:hypothetical protein
MVKPNTSKPCSIRNAAARVESTPPLMATAIRFPEVIFGFPKTMLSQSAFKVENY